MAPSLTIRLSRLVTARERPRSLLERLGDHAPNDNPGRVPHFLGGLVVCLSGRFLDHVSYLLSGKRGG